MNNLNVKELSNPREGIFTNSLINFYDVFVITQNIPSPMHVLPDSYDGRKIQIVNSGNQNITLSGTKLSGNVDRNIVPGDAVILIYANNKWDIVGDNVDNVTFSGTGIVTKSLSGANATFILGEVPNNSTVTKIGINITTPIASGISVRIEAGNNAVIMQERESDLSKMGYYQVFVPVQSPRNNGNITAIFSGAPSGINGEISVFYDRVS